MGQLLAILIIPPLVGVITYAVFRIIWEKEESKQIVSRPVGNSMRGESKAFVQTVIGRVNGDDDNVTRQQGKWGRSPADSL